jgi:serine/threonine protein kinase
VSASPDDLLDVATSVSDGASLDWNVLAATAKIAADPALLRELEVIARIADVHRSAARDAASPGAREERRWGHLVIEEELGAGSFGTVYRAHDPRLERDVALKVYRAGRPVQPGQTSRFAEGRLLARVRHQNVVVVHGLEQHGDEVGLWLELIDGRTLADEVRSGGPLGFREAVLIGQDLCRALAAVHQAGLIHRDVKPQNVMRERGGRIVLMDFGIGRDMQAARSPERDLGGTPLYMAPELFDGGASSVASDIYSVGVLLFYLVTGSYPVVAGSRSELERSHREGRRRMLRDLRPDAPDAFVDVMERACAADPQRRYATAGAMQAALSGVMGLSSETSGTIDRAREPARNAVKPIWLALAAALLVAVAAGAVTLMWHRFPEPSPPTRAATSAGARAATPSSAPVDPDQYQIGASFHRVSGTGTDALAPGAHVAPGDRLFLEVTATKAVHVYIVNQDDRGESYLLFPLPGQALANPLSAGTLHRLPGRGAADERYWQVTSAGGREHFLLVASPEPLGALETVFARLPRPEPGRPVAAAAPLSNEVMGQLRGIGGLTSRPSAQEPASDLLRSAVTLGSGLESVKGPWMRQFTLENPGR